MLIGETFVQQALADIGILLVLAGIAAVGLVYLSRRGQATSTLQTDTITTLEAANTLKGEQIHELERKVAKLEETVVSLRRENDLLGGRLTQTAKVDQLRGEVDEAFQQVNTKLDRILERK